MKRLMIFAAMAMAAFAVTAQGSGQKYSYSGSADEPVISLDYRGSRMQRLTDAPTLSIYADGRVVMPKIYSHAQAYEGWISQDELQGLLDVIIRKQRFFDYSEARVQEKLRAMPGPVRTLPGHLATTVITVNANFTNKSVSHFGLGHTTPVQETERLLAIRQRLDQIMSVMKLGGKAEATRWLSLANAELGSKSPGTQPLSLDDLQSAAIHTDGSAYVRFARVQPEFSHSISVSISMDEAGESTIAIARDDLLPAGPTIIE